MNGFSTLNIVRSRPFMKCMKLEDSNPIERRPHIEARSTIVEICQQGG